MANGDTKTEAMLNVLGNGGTGDEFRGCCNTKTQQYILDAIDRINSIQPGGGEDFIGATSTTAGVHGLVPAPAAGDQDKVLKGDGTWAEISEGGGAKELTSDDFNWNLSLNSATEPYDCVALWLLEPGIYIDNDPNVYIALWSGPYGLSGVPDGTFIINEENPYKHVIFHSSNYSGLREYSARSDTGVRNGDMKEFLRDSNIVQTTGTSTTNIMSQKAVTDALASAGGGGIIELTSADYNYPTDNPTQLAVWLLDDGIYHSASTSLYLSLYSTPKSNGTFVKTTDSSNNPFIYYFNGNGDMQVYRMAPNGTSLDDYTALKTSQVKQAIGNSTTDVMSQDAVAKAIYDTVDSTRGYRPKIGYQSFTGGLQSVAFGDDAKANGVNAVAVGGTTIASQNGAIALGYGARTNSIGEMNIGTSNTSYGYSSSNYRLLSGVHDPVNAHDAATKGYVDAHSGGGSSPIQVLTDNDLNWDSTGEEGDPDSVATWLLDTGWYMVDENSSFLVYTNSDYMEDLLLGTIFHVDAGIVMALYPDTYNNGANCGLRIYASDISTGESYEEPKSINFANLEFAMNQAEEALNRIQVSPVVPTTTTWGEIGYLYSCTANGKLYMCTAIDETDPDNPVYTWTAIN